MYSRVSGVPGRTGSRELGPAARTMRLRSILAFGFVGLSLAGAGVGAELVHREVQRTLPTAGHAARGVKVEGRDIPSEADAAAFIDGVADEELDRPIEVRYD